MAEQQLVEIARALGTDARIVIMDEPTAALPAHDVARLIARVRELRRQGAGVLYITHRLDEVFELADRITVLRDGRRIDTRAATAWIARRSSRSSSAARWRRCYPMSRTCSRREVLAIRNLGCPARACAT